MKSILFIAFLAISIVGCDTPENTTGNDTSNPPMTTDTTMNRDSNPMSSDTVSTMPVDTGSMMPADTGTMMPVDTTGRMPTDTSSVR